MNSEKYKVEVLHYINPHLMWVLVEDEKEHDKYHFEQIGMFGISPLDVSIDYEGNVTTGRSEKWLPAVIVAMKKIFLDAAQVWFSVTFLDNTTSIFDDNLHKYGDLTIKMKDGKTVSFVQQLLDTCFVGEDDQYFHQNLNTKLNYIETLTTVNKIKESLKTLNKPYKHLENILNKQLSIFYKSVELEETMTPRNLDVSCRSNHAEMLLRKQIHDLNACKDVDDVSAGRACNMRTVNTDSKLNSGLLKKLNMIKSPVAIPNETITKETENVNDSYKLKSSPELNNGIDKHRSESQETPKNRYNKKVKKPKAKDHNTDKKLVGIGPPGLNPIHFHLKEVTVENPEEQLLIENNKKEITEKEISANHEIFDEVDSEEINIRFSKLDILRRKAKINNIETNNNILNNSQKEDTNNFVKNENHNPQETKKSSALQRKLQLVKETMAKMNDSSSTVDTDSALRQGDNSDSESISDLVDKLDSSIDSIKKEVVPQPEIVDNNVKHNVNPFKNLDGSKSVFVEKLVSPTLMVHTKKGNCVQPVSNIRDVPFGTNIHIVLRNMSVKKPMRPQTVSWPMILRGHSLFLVSPYSSGKTIGYLPAVCRLVSDNRKADDLSVARLTCIIVCATALSVCNVEEMCKMFLHDATVFACYAGMPDITLTTAILNGCDILVCTPSLLVRMMRENLGLDLRNLTTFVIDDCERISEVYLNEIKYCLFKVKEMLKNRINKELKVQYVVVSRIWCSFMSSLAKKAPDSIVCIGAFQECVLYSEVDTSVQFIKKENKIEAVIDFLKDIDKSKKTVIACRSDDEVHTIKKALAHLNYVVFACDSTMTLHDLYTIDLSLSEYTEPLLGPILVCCDSNLNHLNVTDAHYLIHFSLPEMFSMFSKRFSVLIDNYPSIFDSQHSNVKIKIFLEDTNVEQMPKILHFIKRCSDNVPAALDKINTTVMLEKDLKKAQSFVPLCNVLLSLGKCPDVWYCKQRHSIFQEFDEPRAWLPREGTITFKILHYHSTVNYSAIMLSCTTGNGIKKYPQTYSMLSIKLGMYYSRDVNRKLHGIAKPGDICAVSLKQNLFVRCQVIKVLKYSKNNIPNLLLINLIDEEKYEMASDTCLYHLPDDLKKIESQAVKIILDGLTPHDKDISYSKLATDQLKNITENNEDIFMRGRISLVIGNCIFVETLEACQELSSINEVVVKSNFKTELLNGFALVNPNHITALQKLGEHLDFMRGNEEKVQQIEVPKPIRVQPKGSWAYLESDTYVPVYYLYATSPELFFVQHVKFQDCINNLIKDIKKYMSENPPPIEDVKEGDIVLAEFTDDDPYERARIDSLIDNDKVKCFFVDLGDWKTVPIDKLMPIPDKLITQLPFQAIECRLVGVKPLGEQWSEFSTNWLVDQFYDTAANLKYLFAKRFTKETSQFTEGGKYGISLIDTYANDVCINKLMLDTNLAEESDEIDFLINDDQEKEKKALNDANRSTAESIQNDTENVVETTKEDEDISKSSNGIIQPSKQLALNNAYQNTQDVASLNSSNGSSENMRTSQQTIMNLLRMPIRSVPLVDDDDSDDDRWDSQNAHLMLMDRGQSAAKVTEVSDSTKHVNHESTKAPLLAITDSNSDNVGSKPELIPTTSPITKEKQQNVSTPSNISTYEQNNTPASKTDKKNNNNEQSNGFWSILETENTLSLYDDTSNDDRTIKLIWSQEKKSVTIQIQVIADKYQINIKNKEISFCTQLNGDDCGFELELYGVINIETSSHCNKGTYIEIKLNKLMPKNWLKLNKGPIKKRLACVEKIINSSSTVEDKTEINEKDQLETSFNDSSVSSSSSLVNKSAQMNNFNSYAPTVHGKDSFRKPKLVWRQNKYKVTIKVLLITEKYDLCIKERSLKFSSIANDEEYGFELELYGVVKIDKSSHTNKGQYIQISLTKVMPKHWIALYKGENKKWIVYDVDNIDVSSEDEKESSDALDNLKNNLNVNFESDSDEDFDDDINFGYKKSY